jgi:hypothetical protein
MTLDFESDQFLKLLTDALRAGPGSPQWHEAILRLQAGQEGAGGTDEYRLLCDARLALESGKEYRSVRPGARFTRRVMDAISAEGNRAPRRFSTANLIALIAGVLLLGTVAMFAYLLLASESHSGVQSEAIDALSAKLLGNVVASISMGSIPSPDWKLIGTLPVNFTGGMHPKPTTAKSHDIAAAGLVWQTPMPAETAFEVEATLKVSRSTDDLLPEVAISDSDDFSDENATSSHELVWLLQSGQGKVVLPSGRMDAQSQLSNGIHNPLTVRVRIDQQDAIVEMDGKRIWAGTNGLDGQKPRFIAVRLLRRGRDKQDPIAFQSVRVLTGQ